MPVKKSENKVESKKVEAKEEVKTTKKSSEKKETESKVIDYGQINAEIERLAYEIYLERQKSGKPGDQYSDWAEAERKIKAKYKIK